MKSFKKLLTAGFLAIALAGTAHAQTKIYITGSTAFRSATHNAIASTLSGTVTTASDNASLTSANAVTYTGGNIGGTAVTIKTSWSGSAAGIQTVAGSLNVRFLVDGATGTANLDPRNVANPAEVTVPDISMADNYQTSTLFRNTFLGVPYENLSTTIVGVVTFRWIASNGFPSGQTMTTQLAQYLLGSGAIPVALFTNNTADETVIAYATGRDPDSGTRITAFAESGVGALSTVKQWKPLTFSNGLGTNDVVQTMDLYPIQTINGVSTGSVGNSGESSGSSLRAFTNKTLAAGAYDPFGDGYTGGFFVTYMGTSDATNVLGAAIKPAVSLKYNGVDFSTDAVKNGHYTFWGYQHLMHRSSLGNGTTGGPAVKGTFATNLKNTILATSGATLSPNVKLSEMKVSRSSDGGQVGATYF